MKVTKVKVKKFESGALKGFADVEFEGVLTIKGFKIMDGKDGLWVGNPSQENKKDGKYYDTIFVDKGLKGEIEAEVLSSFMEG